MHQPLAYRLRPHDLEGLIGQEHLTNQGGLFRVILASGQLPSMIFFGPPGTGKTTAARILADALNMPFRMFNAVTGSKKDLDAIYAEARLSGHLVVIIDEVHRLNKDKQDTLLPYVEEGLVTMIGATSANPYFAINQAIRSRTHLVEFHALDALAIRRILDQAVAHKELFPNQTFSEDLLAQLARQANGDARFALNTLELCALAKAEGAVDLDVLDRLSLHANLSADKDDDNHYDLLSAFQKSIRGSDVQASLYYLAKLIRIDDLASLERRLLVCAYEDIGLANPALVGRVLNAVSTARMVGFPEARIPLASIVIELALSPKSKSATYAIDRALDAVDRVPAQVPYYLRLKPVNKDPESLYDYTRPDLWHRIQYLPDALKNDLFYQPINLNSNEKVLKENLDKLTKIKRSANLKKLHQSKSSSLKGKDDND